jgi:NADH:ubiquinone oxidoreductase subunit 6 (subunit J)
MILIILAAILTVELKNLLHAVGCLSIMGVCMGLLFSLLDAQYIMAFQMLVFVGATMVLFVAVVMLTEREEA